MQTTELTIVNKLGLHARAAAKLVQTAAQFSAEVMVSKDGREVNAKSIMGVMMLAASRGTVLQLSADGEDEAAALIAITELVESRFGEKE